MVEFSLGRKARDDGADGLSAVGVFFLGFNAAHARWQSAEKVAVFAGDYGVAGVGLAGFAAQCAGAA